VPVLWDVGPGAFPAGDGGAVGVVLEPGSAEERDGLGEAVVIGRVLWWLVRRVHGAGVDVTEEMLAGIDVMVREHRERDEAR
jgi:hypothetical protein